MTGHISPLFTFVAILIICVINIVANPAIATGYDPLEVCIENCAQCKKMLGAWFEGHLCAESCLEMKGKRIPECENFASIAPFINRL